MAGWGAPGARRRREQLCPGTGRSAGRRERSSASHLEPLHPPPQFRHRFIIVIEQRGRDYEGTPGKLDFRIIEFDTQRIRVEAKEVKAEAPNSKQTPTWTLITAPNPERIAELHWRVALPIAALVLALMAVPLSFVNPRSGASFNLFMAVLIFFLYYNLLTVFQKWTEQGQISPWIGLWPVHIGMIATLLVLFSRQLFSFRWLMFARK